MGRWGPCWRWRITDLRGALGWLTPSVSLKRWPGPGQGGHHDHDHGDRTARTTAREDRLGQLDAVLAAVRAAGDAAHVELRLPRPDEAWMVREYDRSWPTQVDTIALASDTLAVTSRADFETFPLIPKLIRWGMDTRMGVLFGIPNQIAMGLIGVTVYGYRMWRARRPVAGPVPLAQAWAAIGPCARTAGAMPALGASLIVFVAVDVLRWRLTLLPQ